LCPFVPTTERCSSVTHSLSTVAILTTETTLLTFAFASDRLSWRWNVLLPSGTRRKHITSITADLLPFASYEYLLTLHETWYSYILPHEVISTAYIMNT
jgi:hypothetical protein